VATYFDQLYDDSKVIREYKTKIKIVNFILGPDEISIC
jgi:hypothetical protein